MLANLIRTELVNHGIPTFLDDRQFTTRGPIPDMIRREIESATIVVVVLGEGTLESSWVLQELELAQRLGKDTIPVFDESFTIPAEPESASVAALLQQNGVQFNTRHGTYIGEAVARLIAMLEGESVLEPDGEPPEVWLEHLPIPTINQLIGRDGELRQLINYLLDDDISIVSISGFGGNGKSALVDAFLNDIAPGYSGARKVYGWHFFSQEEQGSGAVNSAAFWERALNFFGLPGTPPVHESEKARQLLTLIRANRSILVLDGLEPLQDPPHVNNGQLNDNAMQGFLTSIARDGLPHGGLVVVTTRQRVVELSRFKRAREIELPTLDTDSGARLLTLLGVRGSSQELLSTAAEHSGHPLSLILLARILATDYQGDILHRLHAELPQNDEEKIDGILSYYTEAWPYQAPELLLMYLISLFRRPVEEAELNAVRARSDLAVPLRPLSSTQITRAISHLKAYGLIIARNGHNDTHALIRSYFSRTLQARRPEEFLQANQVLSQYFRDQPSSVTPGDLDGIDPLYRAMYHSCMAHRYADALDIYWTRISRGVEFFSQKQLGAFSSDLSAIAAFFPDSWNEPVYGDLSEEQRGFLLALASFELTALGRLTEALLPRYTEIAMFRALGDWRLVCGDLRNLVQILLPLGRLSEALRASNEAVTAAQRLGSSNIPGTYSSQLDDNYLLVSALARRATVLHRMGQTDEALTEFQEAERLSGSVMDRANGFYYGLLLTDLAINDTDVADVIQRGEASLRTASDRKNIGDMGNSAYDAHAGLP